MKHIFIVNPAAGKSDRTAEYRKMIEAAFAPRGLSYELLVSGAPGECRTLARQAAQWLQGFPSGGFSQLTALARIFAQEVLPVPRVPVNRYA